MFLISKMAMHTQNLQADPRVSLFVTEPDAREVGRFIGAVHEVQGVVFHLAETVKRVDGRTLMLTRRARLKQTS
jgi:hypothetical protein